MSQYKKLKTEIKSGKLINDYDLKDLKPGKRKKLLALMEIKKKSKKPVLLKTEKLNQIRNDLHGLRVDVDNLYRTLLPVTQKLKLYNDLERLILAIRQEISVNKLLMENLPDHLIGRINKCLEFMVETKGDEGEENN